MIRRNLYLLSLVLAFAAGWYSHSHFQQPPALATLPPETRIVVQKDNYIPVFSEPSANAPAQFVDQDEATPVPTPAPVSDQLENFRQLVQSNQFQQAVNLYTERESTISEKQLQQWRTVIHDYLQLKLSNAELALFAELSEIWLNYRYNDIETLLLQAQYYIAKGYINEALHSFIQASSYAPSTFERAQVREKLYKVIVRYDADMANAEEWYELRMFYSQLEQLQLAGHSEKYRYAELLLMNDEDKTAFLLLDEISQNPTWRKKAEELKKLWRQTGDYQASKSPGFAASIPLQRAGQHFIAQVQLNNGKPLALLLDTGASITTINTEVFGEQLDGSNWRDFGFRYFNTANGVARGRMMEVHRVQFGEFTLRDVKIAVLPKNLRDQLDGLLGMNILSRFHFQIDQDASELLLTPR